MKIFQWFKRCTKHRAPGAEHLDSPWGRFGISDADVQAYLNKNDGIEQNVPLQIAQSLLDRSANELVASPTNNALDLARAQGVMQGIAMVALELAKTNKAASERFKIAGNLIEVNHDS